MVTDLDSDSKPNGYIVLYRNCSDCMDLDSNPDLDPYHYCSHFWDGYSIPGSVSESVSGNVNELSPALYVPCIASCTDAWT